MTKLRQTLQISHFDVIRALRYCLLNAVACCLLPVDYIQVFTIFLEVFHLHFFPGITMWVDSLMFQNLVGGLYCLVNVLVQNFSIKIMTRSAQNMQARIFS